MTQTFLKIFLLSLFMVFHVGTIQANISKIDATTIEQALIKLKNVSNLTDEQRTQVKSKLLEARTWLIEAEKIRNNKRVLEKNLAEAPQQFKRLNTHTRNTPETELLHEYSDKSIEQLDSVLQAFQKKQSALQTELANQENNLTNYVVLGKESPVKRIDLKKQIDDLQATQTNSTSIGKEFSQENLTNLSLSTKLIFLRAKLDTQNFTQNNLAQLAQLSQSFIDAINTQLDDIQINIDLVKGVLLAKRDQRSQKTEQQILNLKQNTNLTPLAKIIQVETSSLLNEQRQNLSTETLADQQLQKVKGRLDQIKNDYERITHVVEVADHSEKISRMLLKRRNFAINIQDEFRNLIDFRSQLNSAMLRQLELNEKLSNASDLDKYKSSISMNYPAGSFTNDSNISAEESTKALEQYRTTILDLLKSLSRYTLTLSELSATVQELKSSTVNYQNFLDEKLLWLPNTGPVPLVNQQLLMDGLSWVFQFDALANYANDVLLIVYQHPILLGWWLILIITAQLIRRKALREIKDAAQRTHRITTEKYITSIKAFLYTLILIVPIVILLLAPLFLLEKQAELHLYGQAITHGFLYAGTTTLMLSVVRHVCRQNGLAEEHLRWRVSTCQALVNQIRWIRFFLIPLTMLIGISAAVEQKQEVVAVGRLAFIAAMVLLAISVYKLWRLDSPLMREIEAAPIKNNGVIYHFIWFPILLSLPIALITAALLGYYYTVLYLSVRLLFSFSSLFVLILAKDMLLRRLYVTRRAVRYQEMLQKREVALSNKKPSKPQPETNSENVNLELEKIDYGELSGQARTLISAVYFIALFFALWFVWKDVVPALNIVNSVELPFTKLQLVDGKEIPIALNLGDLLMGLLYASFSFLAAKNLPGLLELALLQLLPLTAPTRYAVTTLTQYLVAMLGITLTFHAFGIQWSNIQWLVAALSVGLGFGLQEIVANFVSGIILLFEQPIRVGDTVTVSNVSGKVARIRIRATTIINWDCQEFIIPNKAFITGEVTNWTLSDNLNRIIITVGIAYGSDARLAMQLIRRAADEHPKVLAEPEPNVTFEEFGDSALTLRLRAYMDDVSIRLATMTDLHNAINDLFNEAGIVIAFPQTDVHFDSTKPMEFVIKKD